jgi:hypothetical protein
MTLTVLKGISGFITINIAKRAAALIAEDCLPAIQEPKNALDAIDTSFEEDFCPLEAVILPGAKDMSFSDSIHPILNE